MVFKIRMQQCTGIEESQENKNSSREKAKIILTGSEEACKINTSELEIRSCRKADR
jgi:hypothetical protein